jgi:hypothetical protein
VTCPRVSRPARVACPALATEDHLKDGMPAVYLSRAFRRPARSGGRTDATACPVHHAASGSAGRGQPPHARPTPGHHRRADTWYQRRQGNILAGPCPNGRPAAGSPAVCRKSLPRLTRTGVGWFLPEWRGIGPYECHNPVTVLSTPLRIMCCLNSGNRQPCGPVGPWANPELLDLAHSVAFSQPRASRMRDLSGYVARN